MNTTREKINPVPYEVELVRDGDKVVEVTIRALPDAELTAVHVRTAMPAIVARLPRNPSEQAARRTQVGRNDIARYTAAVEELELPAFKMAMLIAAYEQAEGRVTDLYLARLADAYETAARDHRDVSTRMAEALDRPLQTIKGHLMRARKDGFLTSTLEGREGGQTTSKAKDLIVAGAPLPDRYRPILQRERENG
jgi:hypothetical protein